MSENPEVPTIDAVPTEDAADLVEPNITDADGVQDDDATEEDA